MTINTCGNYNDKERHIIWQYKYLGLKPEKLSKKYRIMLEQYIINQQFENVETKKHIETMDQKHIHNMVEYDREDKTEELKLKKQKYDKKMEKYDLYIKRKKEDKEDKDKLENKNQILNF